MKMEENKLDMKITIDELVEDKLKAMCHHADNKEWFGFLICDTNKNEINVVDIFIPEQEVSGGDCELDEDAFEKSMNDIMDNKPELLEKVKGVLHSHNNMDVFWSVTDTEFHENFLDYMPNTDIFVSIVINNDGKMLGKALLKINGFGCSVDGVPIIINRVIPKNIMDEAKDIWDNKITIFKKKDTYKYYNTYNTQYNKDFYDPESKFRDIHEKHLPKVTLLDKKHLKKVKEIYDNANNPEMFRFLLESVESELDLTVSEVEDFNIIANCFYENTNFTTDYLFKLKKVDFDSWANKNASIRVARENIRLDQDVVSEYCDEYRGYYG